MLVNPGISCGRCVACLGGRDNFCPDYRMLGEQLWGGEAEYLVVPAQNLVPAPRDRIPLDDAQLAALPISFLTAWQMLVDRAQIRQGETVLVLAAGSGVGTRRDPDRQALRCAGDRHGVDRRQAGGGARARAPTRRSTTPTTELVAEVKRLTDRRGVDIVVEHVGAATFPQVGRGLRQGGANRHLRRHGRVRAGPEPAARFLAPAQHPRLDAWPARLACSSCSTWSRPGGLRPVVHRVMPLEEIAAAHRLLESRETFGSWSLSPGQSDI